MAERRQQRSWSKNWAGQRRITNQLANRVLEDDSMDTCRQAWEGEANPLALCEGLRRCDLPDWLLMAVVSIIADKEMRQRLDRLWASLEKDQVDAWRAFAVLALRYRGDNEVSPWHDVLAQVGEGHAVLGIPSASAVTVRKSYDRVIRDLADRPYRYFTGGRKVKRLLDDALRRHQGEQSKAAGVRSENARKSTKTR